MEGGLQRRLEEEEEEEEWTDSNDKEGEEEEEDLVQTNHNTIGTRVSKTFVHEHRAGCGLYDGTVSLMGKIADVFFGEGEGEGTAGCVQCAVLHRYWGARLLFLATTHSSLNRHVQTCNTIRTSTFFVFVTVCRCA